jgi:hypothetical protein
MARDKFIPRDGRFQLAGVPWLARMIDKGRASLSGTLGEYEFPCSMDESLLKFLGLDAGAFLDLLKSCQGDKELLEVLGLSGRDPVEKIPWSDVFLIRYSRLLDAQEKEEHR